MGQEAPAFPSPAYTTEKTSQAQYNSQAPGMPQPQPQGYYPQQQQQYQTEYRPPHGGYHQSQPQPHAQPQVVYVQQQPRPDNSDAICLPFACCAGCLTATLCCPCFCCF